MDTTWKFTTESGFVFFGTYLAEEGIVYCFCDNNAELASAGTDRYSAMEDMMEAAEHLVSQYERNGEIDQAIMDGLLTRDKLQELSIAKV